MMKNRSVPDLNNVFFDGLNLLRGQACLCVFISHLSYAFIDHFYLGVLGHVGVMIFFVMSGFLAYNKHKDFTGISEGFEYILKKWKHIFPLYMVCTLAIAVPVVLLGKSSKKSVLISLLIHIPMLQSWIPLNSELQFNAVDWYLSVMMFCWVMEPIVFPLISKAKRNTITAVGTIIVLWGIRISLYYISAFCFSDNAMLTEWLMYVFPITRLCDFLIGAYVARLIDSKREFRVHWLAKICIVCFMTLAYYMIPLKCSEALFLLPLACVLVVYCSSKKQRSTVRDKALSIVSRYSEAIFLIHYVMVWYVIRVEKNTGMGAVLSVIAILILTYMGVVLYSIISKKIRFPLRQRSVL